MGLHPVARGKFVNYNIYYIIIVHIYMYYNYVIYIINTNIYIYIIYIVSFDYLVGL